MQYCPAVSTLGLWPVVSKRPIAAIGGEFGKRLRTILVGKRQLPGKINPMTAPGSNDGGGDLFIACSPSL